MRIGGFGEVRKCSNKKTGAIRAVKIIRKDTLDAKEKARFVKDTLKIIKIGETII